MVYYQKAYYFGQQTGDGLNSDVDQQSEARKRIRQFAARVKKVLMDTYTTDPLRYTAPTVVTSQLL